MTLPLLQALRVAAGVDHRRARKRGSERAPHVIPAELVSVPALLRREEEDVKHWRENRFHRRVELASSGSARPAPT
jgi:hypothetical protein